MPDDNQQVSVSIQTPTLETILSEMGRLRGSFGTAAPYSVFSQQGIEQVFEIAKVGQSLYRPPPAPVNIDDLRQLLMMPMPGAYPEVQRTQEYPLRAYGAGLIARLPGMASLYLTAGMFSSAFPAWLRAPFLPAEAVWETLGAMFPSAMQMGVSAGFRRSVAAYMGITAGELRRMSFFERTAAGLRYIAGAPTLLQSLERLERAETLGIGMFRGLRRIEPLLTRLGVGRFGIGLFRATRMAAGFTTAGMIYTLPFEVAAFAAGQAAMGAADVVTYNRLVDTFVRGTLPERQVLSRQLQEDLYDDIVRNARTVAMYDLDAETIARQRILAVGLAGMVTPTRFGRTNINEFRNTVNEFIEVLRGLSRSVRGVSDEIIRTTAGMMAPGLARLPAQMRAGLVGGTIRDIATAANVLGISQQQVMGMVSAGTQVLTMAGMNEALAMSWAARIATQVARPEDLQVLLPAAAAMYRHPITTAMGIAAFRGLPAEAVLSGRFAPADTRSAISALMYGPMMIQAGGWNKFISNIGSLYTRLLGDMATPETLAYMAMSQGFARTPEEAFIVADQMVYGGLYGDVARINTELQTRLDAANKFRFRRFLYGNVITGTLMGSIDTLQERTMLVGTAIRSGFANMLTTTTTELRSAWDQLLYKIGITPRPGELFLDTEQVKKWVTSKDFTALSNRLREMYRENEAQYERYRAMKEKLGEGADELLDRIRNITTSGILSEEAKLLRVKHMIVSSYTREGKPTPPEEKVSVMAKELMDASKAPRSPELTKEQLRKAYGDMMLEMMPRDAAEFFKKADLRPEKIFAELGSPQENLASYYVAGIIYQVQKDAIMASNASEDAKKKQLETLGRETIQLWQSDKMIRLTSEFQRAVSSVIRAREEGRPLTEIAKMLLPFYRSFIAAGLTAEQAQAAITFLQRQPVERLRTVGALGALSVAGMSISPEVLGQLSRIAPLVTGQKDIETGMKMITKMAERTGVTVDEFLKASARYGDLLAAFGPYLDKEKMAIRIRNVEYGG